MHAEKSESRSIWATDTLIAYLKQAHEDGSLAEKATKWYEIDPDQVAQSLKTLETEIERQDFLKCTEPSFYL